MSDKRSSKPLVVVAGQVPPPTGGQNIMIRRIVDELSNDDRWHTIHLPFYFSPSFQKVRCFSFGKVLALFVVWINFLRLVLREGQPTVLLYPSGGPQTVPIMRDILLLPLLCAFSRKVVVQFHAAGIADRLQAKSGVLERLIRIAYRPVTAAIVMTEFNRCDPMALGITNIKVLPHQITDENPNAKLPDFADNEIRFLYAGHLYEMKGTPQLIEAFANIAQDYPHARLQLMGEFLSPYSEVICQEQIRNYNLQGRVTILGVMHGEEKKRIFSESHHFVFPTIAPYESFGLVLVEAMMWGLPILASDWRGNRDVIGESSGLLFSPAVNMVDTLSMALRLRLGQKANWKKYSEQSRLWFEKKYQLTAQPNYLNTISRLIS